MAFKDAPEIHALTARHGLEVLRCLIKGDSHRQLLVFLIGRGLS